MTIVYFSNKTRFKDSNSQLSSNSHLLCIIYFVTSGLIYSTNSVRTVPLVLSRVCGEVSGREVITNVISLGKLTRAEDRGTL